MFAKLTLYNTPFDEENVYVGTNNSTRDSEIEDYAATVQNGKYELPISPYNPRFPFRLKVNYYEIERKYNYLKYEFYKDDKITLVKRKWYFVQEMYFIDDQTTALVCREDLIGEYGADLKFNYCQPDKYTYKLSENHVPFSIDTNSNLFELYYKNDFNFDVQLDNGTFGVGYAFGYLICVATVDNAKVQQYGTTYPVNIYLLPFAIDTNSNKIVSDAFTYYSANIKILSISDYEELSKNTNRGFKIISTNMFFTAKNFLTNESRNNVFFQRNIKGTYFGGTGVETEVDTTITINNASPLRLTINEFESQIVQYAVAHEKYELIYFGADLSEKNPTGLRPNLFAQDVYMIAPFYKILISCGGSQIELNPELFSAQYGARPDAMFKMSVLPPYTFVFFLARNRGDYANGASPLTFTFPQALTGDSAFMSFSDSYEEFLRANNNAMIQGLKVRQATERENLGVSQWSRRMSGLTKEGAGMFNSIIGGAAKNGAMGALAGGITSAISIAGNEGARHITDTGEKKILANNQAKEDALQQLQLADVQNIPNQLAFSNDPQTVLDARTYPRITLMKNKAYDLLVAQTKIYGVSLPQILTDKIKSHTRFDYLRATNFVLDLSTLPKFSSEEMVFFESLINAGVRMWYTLTDFKNFDIDNPEVTE